MATFIHRVFEINSNFLVKQRTTGKIHVLFFKIFLPVLTKFSFWLKLFGRPYIPCSQVIIAHHFNCGEKKIW